MPREIRGWEDLGGTSGRPQVRSDAMGDYGLGWTLGDCRLEVMPLETNRMHNPCAQPSRTMLVNNPRAKHPALVCTIVFPFMTVRKKLIFPHPSVSEGQCNCLGSIEKYIVIIFPLAFQSHFKKVESRITGRQSTWSQSRNIMRGTASATISIA